MSRPYVHRVASLWVVLAVLGCGSRGAVFSGATAAPKADETQILEFANLPAGHQELGRVRAGCKREEPAFEAESSAPVALSDLLCSEQMLGFALRQRAAAVGGTALVGHNCRLSGDEEDRRIVCDARVARAEDAPAAVGMVAVRYDQQFPEAPLLKNMDDAWNVQVHFTPTGEDTTKRAQAPREARPPHLVNEVSDMPVQDVLLGDLVARGSEECADSSVRESLRVAAGRLGATDVVGVRCVRKGATLFCGAQAAAPLH